MSSSPELLERLYKEAHTVYLLAASEAIQKLCKGETIEQGTIYDTGKTSFMDISTLTIVKKPFKPISELSSNSEGISLKLLIDKFNSVPETIKKSRGLLEKYYIPAISKRCK